MRTGIASILSAILPLPASLNVHAGLPPTLHDLTLFVLLFVNLYG
jgi:hypothetical protein